MPKKGIYSQTPVVPEKQIAGTNPIPGPEVGKLKSPTVPVKEGQLHGTGTPTKPFGHPSVKGAHGFGHVAHLKHGHLRLSGNPNAHQLGKTKYKTAKVPM